MNKPIKIIDAVKCRWWKPCKWSKWVTTWRGINFFNCPLIDQKKTCTDCGKVKLRTQSSQ